MEPNPKGVMEKNNRTMMEIDRHNRSLGKKSSHEKALGNAKGGKIYEKKIKSGVNIIKNGKVDSKMSRLFGLDK